MFKDVILEISDMDKYAGFIPEDFRNGFRSEGTSVCEVYDRVGDEENFFGLSVTAVEADWMELVNVHVADPEAETVEKAAFYRHIISEGKKRHKAFLKGAFIEVPEDEASPDLEDVLKLSGMDVRFGDGNVYEFTLGQVGSRDSLKKAASRMKCLKLEDADEKLIKDLENLMQKDIRPVPVKIPVNRDAYIPDISLICMNGKKPCGAMLVSMKDDLLVIELGYSADAMSIASLIWNVTEMAEAKYGAGQNVLVPVVVNKTSAIVERMVPEARRTRILRGVVRF